MSVFRAVACFREFLLVPYIVICFKDGWPSIINPRVDGISGVQWRNGHGLLQTVCKVVWVIFPPVDGFLYPLMSMTE